MNYKLGMYTIGDKVYFKLFDNLTGGFIIEKNVNYDGRICSLPKAEYTIRTFWCGAYLDVKLKEEDIIRGCSPTPVDEHNTVINGDFSSDVWEWNKPLEPRHINFLDFADGSHTMKQRKGWVNKVHMDKKNVDEMIEIIRNQNDNMILFNSNPKGRLSYHSKLPTKVFFNDKKKATTLMFGENATVVKAGNGDEYSKRIGFLEAYFQATCGLSKTQAKKYLLKIVEGNEK